VTHRAAVGPRRGCACSSSAGTRNSKGTWHELDALGCDAIQGFYVSRPVPPDDLITWLQQQVATPGLQRSP
jgi:predicted signal transduction protein with EAL and GGDEF domain